MPSTSQKSQNGRALPIGLLPTLLLTLALVGCSGYPAVLSPASPEATQLSDLFWMVVGIALVIFFVVEGLLIFAVLRFRDRPGALPPRQVHGNLPMEIAWTIIPTIVVAGIFWATIQTMENVTQMKPDALRVKVVGYQWWWKIEYPDHGITTAAEMHVPVGRPVAVDLVAGDVIHSFWAPALFGKSDVIPGHGTRTLFTAREAGIFRGQCAEFCGAQHANMGFLIVAESQDEFDEWTRRMQRPSPLGQASPGAQAFTTCAACHTVAGTQAQGTVGPNLTNFGRRRSIASLTLQNTPDNLASWLANPQAVKPGTKMPNLGLSREAIQDLVAYLESLK